MVSSEASESFESFWWPRNAVFHPLVFPFFRYFLFPSFDGGEEEESTSPRFVKTNGEESENRGVGLLSKCVDISQNRDGMVAVLFDYITLCPHHKLIVMWTLLMTKDIPKPAKGNDENYSS